MSDRAYVYNDGVEHDGDTSLMLSNRIKSNRKREMIVTPENLNNVMEFDHVIRVHGNGAVSEPTDVASPDYVYQECDAEGRCVDDIMHGADGWSFLTGYTGQYSYHGPVMHESEFIGGGLARDILATPRIYVAVPVYAEGENENNEAFGWAIAYRVSDDDE